jgi:superoxide dismutase, Cu-Zn family
MIADGHRQVGRHRREADAVAAPAGRWRRVAAAAVSLGIAGFTVAALSAPAGASSALATATLLDANGNTVGLVKFKGEGRYGNRLEVNLAAPEGAPGLGAFHGLHIHAIGTCDAATSFTSAGPHLGHDVLNPSATPHGTHKGDLPSVLFTPTGEAYIEVETARFDVLELLEGDGSAVVLHAGPDNFANIPQVYGPLSTATLGTGDAGGRYACGVIEGR